MFNSFRDSNAFDAIIVLEKINEILKKTLVLVLISKFKKKKNIIERVIVWIKKTVIKPLLRKYDGFILRPKEKRSSKIIL